MGATLLADSVGDDEFREYIFEAAERAQQESVEEAIAKVSEAVEANLVLQTPEGIATLEQVLTAAQLEAPPTPEQAAALTRAAARAASEQERQAKEDAYHKAFDAAISHSPYATGEGEPTREFWPTPGGESDEFDREVEKAQRIAEAISSDDPQSDAEIVEKEWAETIDQQQALQDEWDATMTSVRERAAQEAAQEAADA
jgi:hypothetical protein